MSQLSSERYNIGILRFILPYDIGNNFQRHTQSYFIMSSLQNLILYMMLPTASQYIPDKNHCCQIWCHPIRGIPEFYSLSYFPTSFSNLKNNVQQKPQRIPIVRVHYE
jgi:hypothetical protein